jgi:hypothetical protein
MSREAKRIVFSKNAYDFVVASWFKVGLDLQKVSGNAENINSVSLKKVPARGLALNQRSRAGRILVVLDISASVDIEFVADFISNQLIGSFVRFMPFLVNRPSTIVARL